jgi:hypothetical protein
MRRADSYETRARELAAEAGLDPDGRVERPGLRSMPVWCTFRDAARTEHLARQAATLELPPQAAEYRDSPLKVYGAHHDATIAQMHNCMSVCPIAYRRLPEVLDAHAGTVRIQHTLRPFVVVMAGVGEVDPFKD